MFVVFFRRFDACWLWTCWQMGLEKCISQEAKGSCLRPLSWDTPTYHKSIDCVCGVPIKIGISMYFGNHIDIKIGSFPMYKKPASFCLFFCWKLSSWSVQDLVHQSNRQKMRLFFNIRAIETVASFTPRKARSCLFVFSFDIIPSSDIWISAFLSAMSI